MIDYGKIVIVWSILLSSTSCVCMIKVKDFDAFPSQPKYEEYIGNENPVISFDPETKTYKVSSKMVENALYNDKYIEEVIKWKHRNGVE